MISARHPRDCPQTGAPQIPGKTRLIVDPAAWESASPASWRRSAGLDPARTSSPSATSQWSVVGTPPSRPLPGGAAQAFELQRCRRPPPAWPGAPTGTEWIAEAKRWCTRHAMIGRCAATAWGSRGTDLPVWMVSRQWAQYLSSRWRLRYPGQAPAGCAPHRGWYLSHATSWRASGSISVILGRMEASGITRAETAGWTFGRNRLIGRSFGGQWMLQPGQLGSACQRGCRAPAFWGGGSVLWSLQRKRRAMEALLWACRGFPCTGQASALLV